MNSKQHFAAPPPAPLSVQMDSIRLAKALVVTDTFMSEQGTYEKLYAKLEATGNHQGVVELRDFEAYIHAMPADELVKAVRALAFYSVTHDVRLKSSALYRFANSREAPPTKLEKKISGKRIQADGQVEYLVDWERTWEPSSNLEHCAELVGKYEINSHKKRK